MDDNRRVLITGGGTFLGHNIAAALLAEGADVTLLVRPDGEKLLGPLAQMVRWQTTDVWDSASLRGRARGHDVVIHTVGSLAVDPSQGLTYHRMNFVSARNVITMCVNDGVSRLVFMSTANAPWINNHYIRAKREAEEYLERVGVNGIIIRAPLVYLRGQRRPVFFEMTTLLGRIPLLSRTRLGRMASLPIDVLARGVARIALEDNPGKTIYYSRDLWRKNTKIERSGRASASSKFLQLPSDDGSSARPDIRPFQLLDDDSPFGWQPKGEDE